MLLARVPACARRRSCSAIDPPVSPRDLRCCVTLAGGLSAAGQPILPMTTRHEGNERLWSEWLSLYLEHCRRELGGRELSELADALELGVTRYDAIELDSVVSEHVACVARPLVDFIANAGSARSRAALSEEAARRLRSAASGRRAET